MLDVIRRQHYSIRSEQGYTDWIHRLILFHGKRHPSETREWYSQPCGFEPCR